MQGFPKMAFVGFQDMVSLLKPELNTSSDVSEKRVLRHAFLKCIASFLEYKLRVKNSGIQVSG